MKSYSFFSRDLSPNLTEKERGILNYLEFAIDSRDTAMIDKVNNSVTKYSSDAILKLCNASSKFSNYCQINAKFHETIAKKMKQYNCISIEIYSMDNKEHLGFFDILLAANYFDEYKNKKQSIPNNLDELKVNAIQLLNKSCEIGLYDALIARCRENALLWIKKDLSDEEKLKIEEVIWKDINRLANLYWGMGYILAGRLLCEFAKSLAEIDGELDRALTMYEEGLKRTLCASFLEDHAYSKEIEKSVTRGKGYFIHYYDPKCRHWDDYKMQLCQWSGSNANYERLYKLAKQEIEGLLQNNQNESKLDF